MSEVCKRCVMSEVCKRCVMSEVCQSCVIYPSSCPGRMRSRASSWWARGPGYPRFRRNCLGQWASECVCVCACVCVCVFVHLFICTVHGVIRTCFFFYICSVHHVRFTFLCCMCLSQPVVSAWVIVIVIVYGAV